MGRLFDDLERLNGSRFIEDEAPIHYLKTMWFGKRAEAEKQLLGQAFRLMIGYGRPLAYLGIDFEAKGEMLLEARSNLSSGNIAGPWPDDFLLALISAYENDEEDYTASMKMLGELSGTDNIYSHEILLAQGYWLHTQGDYIQSNEILDSAMTTYGRAVDGLIHAFTEGAITLVQAENYYGLGQKAKSLLYYNILTDVLNAGDDEKMGYSWLRRGEICGELGRNEEALQFFNYFLEMYADCDPAFEPWVERAEAGREEVFSRLN
jgi:tetratricopeptide (TPR) repeat protein